MAKKIEFIRYSKNFDSFSEGIKELLSISQVIAKLFPEGTAIHTHENAAASLIRIIFSNIPSIQNEEYPNFYAIDLYADRCSFRTPHHVSFDWKIYADKKENDVKYSYQFRISVIKDKFAANQIAERAQQLNWVFEPQINK